MVCYPAYMGRPCPECNAWVDMCSCGEWGCGFYSHLGSVCPSLRGERYRAEGRIRTTDRLLSEEIKASGPPSADVNKDNYAIALINRVIAKQREAMTIEEAHAAINGVFKFNIRPLTKTQERMMLRLNEIFSLLV